MTTIHHLSSTPSSRWAEYAAARSGETREREPTPADKTERSEAQREGPRRSPLFNAIKDALTELVARAPQAEAPAATEAAPDAATEAAADNDELAQAITEFARALTYALRDGRGPQGEGRGRHFGHAHGHRRHGGDNAAQRVDKLAREIAPAPSEAPEAKPVDAPTEAAADVPFKQAEVVPITETTAAPVKVGSVTTAAGTPAVSVRLTLELTLPESPWKSAHDGLIESFAEVQRAVGRADKADGDDDKSIEEQLREMLVALAAKLRTTAVNTAALAPAGSLLSVVA